MIFFFSTKTYIVGTQKNRFNEMFLLITKTYAKIMGKIRKYLQLYVEKVCLIPKPVCLA